MVTIRIFSIWWSLFTFYIKWQRWCKVLCQINCNHKKKNIFNFLMGRPYYTLKPFNIVFYSFIENHWDNLIYFPFLILKEYKAITNILILQDFYFMSTIKTLAFLSTFLNFFLWKVKLLSFAIFITWTILWSFLLTFTSGSNTGKFS